MNEHGPDIKIISKKYTGIQIKLSSLPLWVTLIDDFFGMTDRKRTAVNF